MVMRVIKVAAVIAVFVGVWLSFDYGRQRAGFDSDAAAEQHKVLLEQLDEIRSANDELRSQNAILVQAGEIDRKAYAEVDNALHGADHHGAELRCAGLGVRPMPKWINR